MKFVSTNNDCPAVSLKEALFQGLAPDGGLYFPENLPALTAEDFEKLRGLSFNDLAFEILKHYAVPELSEDQLKAIIKEAFDFEPQLIRLSDGQYIMELFHGPTLAFKDFGARLLASFMSSFLAEGEKLTILVATSGDTGSAVAQAFHNKAGFRVVILFPKGKVSEAQEKQFSTLGGNVTSLAVDGTFDDCQALVKQAFQDKALKEKFCLTSANSINIGRLLPQSLYFAWAYAQLGSSDRKLIFSVPTGNIGNLTSGLMLAQAYGLNCHFVAAVNANSVFADYLETGNYEARASVSTLSNAMDVGRPSNFERLSHLYNDEVENFRKIISAYSFSDEETLKKMKDCWEKHQYLLDPHGAVAVLGSEKFHESSTEEYCRVSLLTAHPAKFMDVVEKALNSLAEMPQRLQDCLKAKSQSKDISKDYDSFKKALGEL
jgi:threonine synthase